VRQELGACAVAYRRRGLNWGVGLSPFALYRDYSDRARGRLRDKLGQISDLGGNLLAILFDDMPGDCPDLAARQGEIIADVERWCDSEFLLTCPTYYSFDPLLERHFGTMPENYWSELCRDMPPRVQVLWTGNQVCSASISTDDIRAISAKLGRKPALWDNYPVNDGERGSNFLHLTPLPGRQPELREELTAHFCNPMNQPLLSRYPLAGLAQLYGGRTAAAGDFFSPALCRQLQLDQQKFEVGGLSAMSASERRETAEVYERITDPAAAEIADWLRGGYRFDPACLTG
jgi:hypothetical protein